MTKGKVVDYLRWNLFKTLSLEGTNPDFSSGGKLRPKVKKTRTNRFLDATYFDNEALKRDICLSG